MPISANELSERGKTAIDHYLKNNPIDQVAVMRPLMKAMMAGKKEFDGAKQYVVEQLRVRYSSNFQWYYGANTVSYNTRNTVEQVSYPWRSAHDGLMLDEDRLAAHGITISDDAKASPSASEKVALTNLFDEQMEVLRLGFEEKFSAYLHFDGTLSTDSFAGLDLLVSSAPTTGTVGGLDRATQTYWRNNAVTGLTSGASGTILDQMETMWRACRKNGGSPNKIIAGGGFIDAYRTTLEAKSQRWIDASQEQKREGSNSGLYFRGIEIEYAPEFDDNFGGLVSPAIGWTKRCYMLDTSKIKLRPMKGQNMRTRTPPRTHDAYVFYWAVTWKGAVTMNQANAHAFLSIA